MNRYQSYNDNKTRIVQTPPLLHTSCRGRLLQQLHHDSIAGSTSETMRNISVDRLLAPVQKTSKYFFSIICSHRREENVQKRKTSNLLTDLLAQHGRSPAEINTPTHDAHLFYGFKPPRRRTMSCVSAMFVCVVVLSHLFWTPAGAHPSVQAPATKSKKYFSIKNIVK